jgi:tetratricopeptide (TPR) repeat protein
MPGLFISHFRQKYMLNTKLYKSVHTLAGKLMKAADNDDRAVFDSLYAELEAICMANENSEKDHPVQWETLADFTEDLDEALSVYEQALAKAAAINAKDYMSSIAYSMATLQIEQGESEVAIKSLQDAKINANKIEDKVLKSEIHDLLESLLDS